MRVKRGAPLWPHQVSFQSRLLLEESFFELSLEVAESLDEEEVEELAFEIDIWLARLFPVNHGIRRGRRDLLALFVLLGDGDRPSTAPGGIQCPEGRHTERVWRPEEEGVCGRDGIFDFGVALSSGLGVLRVEGAGLAAAAV